MRVKVMVGGSKQGGWCPRLSSHKLHQTILRSETVMNSFQQFDH